MCAGVYVHIVVIIPVFYWHAHAYQEADDVDYQSESSVEDIIDSDFAIDSSSDENEKDDASADEEGGKHGRRGRRNSRVVTKSYKVTARRHDSLSLVIDFLIPAICLACCHVIYICR